MTDRPPYSLPERLYEEANRWAERCDAGEPGVTESLAAWLASDPRHRQAYEESRALLGEARIVPKGLGGFDGNLTKAPFYARQSTHIALGTAAAVFLVGLATVWASGHHLLPQLVTPAEAATYETGIGEIRTFRLADASAITLDTDTRISVSLSGGIRDIVIAKGRIRVESAPGSGSYAVSAGTNSATVQGGVFDAFLTGAVLRIAAPHGAVELNAAEPPTGAPRQIAAGSQIEIGSPASTSSVPGPDVEWVSGMLALNGTRLDQAVEAINRYNRAKIRLGAQELGSRKLSGAFPVGDPEGFAEAVGKMLDLHVDLSNPAQIVLSKQ
ncbi:FecR domain-containing protein [Novosphingobium sp. YAF33]|uniref:FecR domain-containing protein n=1 Tax=Novosphingobium sp. YAF33 TaxID=3233082 RepID=UPI003F9BC73C